VTGAEDGSLYLWRASCLSGGDLLRVRPHVHHAAVTSLTAPLGSPWLLSAALCAPPSPPPSRPPRRAVPPPGLSSHLSLTGPQGAGHRA
jgi:hypothetical protein